MTGDVQAIRSADGLLLIGEPEDVERFVKAQRWRVRRLDSAALTRLTGLAATGLHRGAALAAGSGQWVQLTAEAAQKVSEMGLSISSTTGNASGVFRNAAGQIAGHVEFILARPGSPTLPSSAARRASWRRWRCSSRCPNSATTSPSSTPNSTTSSDARRATSSPTSSASACSSRRPARSAMRWGMSPTSRGRSCRAHR